ncbi:kelch-like protein 2 [Adelges cooleyi]|uniref:kelch-like protein 2 n=1 Tax=Adelges cooleyi TaxID=133065 RepID=UPI00217FCBBE|nr:kelch-like protein 2 [Adelges cooleyi]XP_050420872.1 kelch-like protein 2 [Adelges cooleyi]XP_050420873.1 kelch-like protein 2 [Adelges cooleyi]
MAEQFKHFYTFLQEKKFCDITLVSDEGLEIQAHKIILASASSVFYTMFTAPFKESKENDIVIKKMDSKVLQAIVKFAYTSTVDIKERYVEKLWLAADFYDLCYIKESCSEYIKENINPTNCVSFMKTSDLISDKEIYAFCWSYFLKNFTMVVNSDLALKEICEFPIDYVLKFIKHDDLVINNEEKIFDFIICWISHNTYERSHLLSNLMKHLRLHLISEEGLQRICNEPLVRSNIDILMDLKKEMANTKPLYTLGRNTEPNIIFAINGHTNGRDYCIKYMDTRSEDNLEWKTSNHLVFCPPRKDTIMVVTENGFMLSIGGTDESGNDVNLVDELDLKSTSKQWVPTTPLNKPRTFFEVCTHKQYIYVVGGFNSSGRCFSNSVEYYDTNSKVWTEIAEPMPTARCRCSAIISNNQLYVFGGANENYLATVECYDIGKKYWKQLDPMPISNSRMAITRILNVIYLIGGYKALRRVLKFDLQHFNWDEMPNMHSGTYDGTSSVVIGDKDLFVFVNDYGTLQRERYDAEAKQWQLVDKTGEPSQGFGRNIIALNDFTLKSYGIHL